MKCVYVGATANHAGQSQLNLHADGIAITCDIDWALLRNLERDIQNLRKRMLMKKDVPMAGNGIRKGARFRVASPWEGCSDVGVRAGDILCYESQEQGCPGMYRLQSNRGVSVHAYDQQILENLEVIPAT